MTHRVMRAALDSRAWLCSPDLVRFTITISCHHRVIKPIDARRRMQVS
jgi:hypothetical protein